jgi:hypothetical protein
MDHLAVASSIKVAVIAVIDTNAGVNQRLGGAGLYLFGLIRR